MGNNIQTTTPASLTNRRLRPLLCLTLLTGLLALSSVIAATHNNSMSGAAAAAGAAAASPVPQGAIRGEWTAGLSKEKADKINLTLNLETDKGNRHTMGSDVSLAELQGLTREQASGARTDVKFRLVREAGTFEFEGTFSEGKGAGSWTLVPSQTFISDMRARGFELSEERQIASAMLDVRTKTVDDLKAAGFTHLSMEDVIKATIFKITPEFIGELKSIGFENLGLEELVKARIFKITPEFARQVQAMGFGEKSLESLVKMRIFKVTPEFLSEMRGAGLENLSIEDLVKLRIFKIDADFIQRARAGGLTNPDVEELVRMRIHERAR
jgi:hypothetical protein